MPTDVTGIYDRLGAGYDRLSGLLNSVGVNKLRTDLLARARGEVVEVAVGTGVNLRHYPDGTRMTGLDLAGKALVAARTQAAEHQVDFVGVRGDAARLPFGDGSVDTVVCTMAGCVFPAPAAAFQEVRRIRTARPSRRCATPASTPPCWRPPPAGCSWSWRPRRSDSNSSLRLPRRTAGEKRDGPTWLAQRAARSPSRAGTS